MAGASRTMAGRTADAVLPPALSLRLRVLKLRRDVYGHRGPPRILAGLIPPGCIGIDVGAHRGLWTYRISHHTTAVHAFEPNPELYAYLSRTRIRGVRTHAVALSDRDGTAVLSTPHGVGSSGRASIGGVGGEEIASVRTRPLDWYGFTNVGFMKVDVEGHEEAVLNGALVTLRTCHPVLFVEIEERHNPGALTRIPRLLADIGYAHGYFLYRGRLEPLHGFDLETHQRTVDSDVSADYVNNFVFATEAIA